MDLSKKDDAEILKEAQAKLAGPWPEDKDERIEAKLDAVLGNHLPHVEVRLSRLERLFLEKQRWQFWTGLATLGLVLYQLLH